MVKNGVYHENSFNAIMATTRNRDLDDLANGVYLGTSDEMREERLRFDEGWAWATRGCN